MKYEEYTSKHFLGKSQCEPVATVDITVGMCDRMNSRSLDVG